MNWCRILGHKWYYFRYKIGIVKCKRCGKYRKNKTLQEEWDGVGKAIRELVLVVAKESGLRKLLDWLVRKMEKGIDKRRTQ